MACGSVIQTASAAVVAVWLQYKSGGKYKGAPMGMPSDRSRAEGGKPSFSKEHKKEL